MAVRYLGLSSILAAAGLSGLAFAYEADKASTETLWQIKDKAERVKKDTARRGDYYGMRMQSFLNEKITTGGVVFLGDSLTNRFPLDEAFKDGFKGKPVYNRGIGGDRIEGVLERLDVSVIDLAPSEIHVLIGGNDVLWPVDYKDGNLKPGFKRIFRSLKVVASQATIYAYTLCPIDASQDRLGHCVKDALKANEQLREVCKTEGIELRDLFAIVSDRNGHYKRGFTVDGIHLSKRGYLNWIDLLFNDPKEKFHVWENVAGVWMSPPYAKIDGINVGRGEDMLILYERDDKTTEPTTLTNGWGSEALVENGVVADYSALGSMKLPKPPGFVLSGHGKMSDWINFSCVPGARVELSEDKTSVTIHRPKVAVDNAYDNLRILMLKKLAECHSDVSRQTLSELAVRLDDLRKGKALDPYGLERALNAVED